MNPHRYQRAILGLLKTDYGVVDAAIARRGPHPKLTFTHAGRPHTVILMNSPSDNDLKVKQRDLRRLLGQPIERKKEDQMSITVAEPRSLEARVAEPDHGNGKIAIYPSDGRLRFFIPADVVKTFNHAGGCEVRRFDRLHWEIKADQDLKAPVIRRKGNQLSLDAHPDLATGLPRAGTQLADYALVDGAIIARLIEKPAPRHMVSIVSERVVEKKKRQRVPSETNFRTTLEAIRRIEAQTPYRLVKTAGRWVFRAPMIE